jgi:hypothetical protein
LRLAARIAINRTVAGVHFPADSVAGAILGLTLGQYLVNRASGVANSRGSGFDGTAYPNGEDFNLGDIYDVAAMPPAMRFIKPYVIDLGVQAVDQSGALNWLWGKAVAEWA